MIRPFASIQMHQMLKDLQILQNQILLQNQVQQLQILITLPTSRV